MPLVLMVLFVLALLITLAGYFLSSRSQSPVPKNDYLITTRGRRIVDSPPIPARAHRQITRANSPSAGRSRTDMGTLRPRVLISQMDAEMVRPRASMSVLSPVFWEPLIGRINSWKILIPGLITLCLLGVYLVSVTLPHEVAWTSPWFSQPSTKSSSQPQAQPVYTASQHVTRLNQLDPAQYQSLSSYNTWAYSACSAAAMTEVINSYGHKYRIANILTIEAQIGAITPSEGLLEEGGIQQTGAKFGFKTKWGDNTLNLNQLIAAANKGTPVIISFPPATYPGGHILVVRGGNSSYVYLADSSDLNWTQLTHARFMQFWRGFSAIMTPA